MLATLVRHHLLLVETATRRDLDDPATVALGRRRGRHRGHAGTAARAHRGRRAGHRARRLVGLARLARRRPGQAGRRRARRATARTEPEPAAPTAEQERLAIEALRTGRARCSRCAPRPSRRRRRSSADRRSRNRVGVELLIAVPDQPGVLPAVGRRAGAAPADRPRGRTARRSTCPDERRTRRPVLLLNWRVAAEYGSLPQAARLRADLVRALDGSLDIAGRLAERDAAYPRAPGRQAPPPRVTVAPAASRLATVIEVRAQDAPGLLHRIGRALEDAGVRVRSAHVSTLGANAVDAFYVTGPDGAPLPAAEAAGRGAGAGGDAAGGTTGARDSARAGRGALRSSRARAADAGLTASSAAAGYPGRPTTRGDSSPRPRGPTTAVFDTLSDRLAATFKNLRGKGRLSEADIDATAREIRIALLEADVALPVVRTFIKQVKERAARRRGLPGAEPRPAGHQDRQRGARRHPRRRDPPPAVRQEPADRDHARRSPGCR